MENITFILAKGDGVWLSPDSRGIIHNPYVLTV